MQLGLWLYPILADPACWVIRWEISKKSYSLISSKDGSPTCDILSFVQVVRVRIGEQRVPCAFHGRVGMRHGRMYIQSTESEYAF